jgi:hypothetical protein
MKPWWAMTIQFSNGIYLESVAQTLGVRFA